MGRINPVSLVTAYWLADRGSTPGRKKFLRPHFKTDSSVQKSSPDELSKHGNLEDYFRHLLCNMYIIIIVVMVIVIDVTVLVLFIWTIYYTWL
jgi:hypothetical protein